MCCLPCLWEVAPFGLGPQGPQDWPSSPLCFGVRAHIGWRFLGCSLALGPCLDSDGFSFWNAHGTGTPGQWFSTCFHAAFSLNLSACLGRLACTGVWRTVWSALASLSLPRCWIVCVEGDPLLFLSCEMDLWGLLVQEMAILRLNGRTGDGGWLARWCVKEKAAAINLCCFDSC